MSWAHPRSRGENEESASDIVRTVGSSPLTRGKPHHLGCDVSDPGLIPAHAGKTIGGSLSSLPMTAHPRSRGENGCSRPAPRSWKGSSPLTRGKRPRSGRPSLPVRLIPAHAGKTTIRRRAQSHYPAHPRSRGENRLASFLMPGHAGSSPLTRGKPTPRRRPDRERRLIPAHAGKTRPARGRRDPRSAHPRSRGENTWSWPTNPDSPWLIPAHAGKTLPRDSLQRGRRAHPRSRGENMKDPSEAGMPAGSSPLTRGKL